ncbi:hypothetical protein SPRG_14872 [Saprolegnia parasitica CBS 223.65]|uniref:RING-type domain-containing protein n=1 Tax=Saprolegnia parasitica (strain CBS 223.65) TaxID=695850 RepID=A0A067BXQ6_SAPPC|nr:hypothetical protein SPRG_14872 [Saprolegnia parasitica CBS 223.65]KDO19352.1 hypothetical protein SPRG_14872 [Saprolegnia parasitica CBS 223.65]|eukprot:XP_012209940.1 hypothetical protein SPRG_14872 [Saprolegnia parasitica CBS 223.65]
MDLNGLEHVRVEAYVEKGVVMYRIALICPVLGQWWVILARYSKIRAFYDRLCSMHLTLHWEKHAFVEALSTVVPSAWFPPRRLSSSSLRVQNERIHGFRAFFVNLLNAKLHLASRRQSHTVVRDLVILVQTFLRTPYTEAADAPPLTPIGTAPEMDDEIPVGVPLTEAPAVSALFNNDCTICLVAFTHDEFQTAGHIVKTSCDHLFHASCIDSWIGLAKTTCPLCRDNIAHITGLYND